MEQTINEINPITYYAIVAFLVFMIGLLLYHFLYKVPKDKADANKPIIDTSKPFWGKIVDEDFNCN